MLSPDEFLAWATAKGLAPKTIALVDRLRNSEPGRRVKNTSGNYCGGFPSEKLGKVIQWESMTGERACVLLWEYDADTLEVWDQCLQVKLHYTLPNGKRAGDRTWIDFLKLDGTGAVGVDFKTSSELMKLCVDKPYRWVQTGPDSWDQPPARDACAKLGLGYYLLTDRDVPHTLARNIDFLRPRLLRSTDVPLESRSLLSAKLQAAQRVLLSEAISLVGDADVIYEGHFRRYWHLELLSEPLANIDCAWVYADAQTYTVYQAAERCRDPRRFTIDPDAILPGSTVTWGHRAYFMLNRTAAFVFLQTPDAPLAQLSCEEFRRLVQAKEILVNAPVPISTNEGFELLRHASPESVIEAVEKLKILENCSSESSASDLGAKWRTVMRWKAKYREFEARYGNGFLGLITQDHLKGNRTPRTETKEQELMAKAFKFLKAPLPRDVSAGYAYYIALCEEEHIEPRSQDKFYGKWKRQDIHQVTEDREGKRAAQVQMPPRMSGGAHVNQGPVEGDSPFARVHIDHRQSDMFCRRLNGVDLIGKPWFSIAIDAFTRLVLGLWTSMLEPSHASVMMVLRDIVRRHGKLPMMVITDGGREFQAKLIQQMLALNHCEHALRPNSEPRYGNPVERMNLTIDHHLTTVLLGSNEVLKKPRMSSSTHDPRDLAYLTVPGLAEKAEDLMFRLYPDMPHGALGSTPNKILRSASITQGTSWGRPTPFDDVFIRNTLARAHKHGGLMRQRDGIRLNGHNYYASEIAAWTHKKMEDVPFYDPEDPTYISARINRKWERCALIDSQLRRLPPEAHRKYYLSEQIYLSRPSTSRDDTHAFLKELGQSYIDAEREREQHAQSEEPEDPADEPTDPGSHADSASNEEPAAATSSAAPAAPLEPFPISRRSH